MREIKFRAWHKSSVTNGSPYMDYILYLDNVGINDQIKIAEDKNWILMQYIGLKDKNDKKIYEGDIVQHDDGDICVVDLIIPISNIKDDLFSWANLDYEVIGNIYENPELLEKM
jgi:uncharacterized phage protein (TIGR01671 family)